MGADRRAALATNLMLFFASIAFAGLILAVFNDAFWTIEAAAVDVGDTEQAAQGLSYVTAFWDLLPIVIAFLGLIQLVGAAALEARVP